MRLKTKSVRESMDNKAEEIKLWDAQINRLDSEANRICRVSYFSLSFFLSRNSVVSLFKCVLASL